MNELRQIIRDYERWFQRTSLKATDGDLAAKVYRDLKSAALNGGDLPSAMRCELADNIKVLEIAICKGERET